MKVTCNNILIIALLLLPLAEPPAAELAKIKKPNILFLMTDQQTVSALGCAGNPYVKTPNLDRLAARGIRFTESYVSFPLCSPSRASLFSSRMPHELGIYGNNNCLLYTSPSPRDRQKSRMPSSA